MIETLKTVECESAIVAQRGKLGINKKNVVCNYYDYLEGKVQLSDIYMENIWLNLVLVNTLMRFFIEN